jgi:parallel beta-helix repeat protein
MDEEVWFGGKRLRKLALRVEHRRLISAMIALLFCLSAMLGLLGASSSDRTDTATREGPTAAKTLALTVHDAIVINGNAGFTGPNASTGITRGSGTSSDPYVIENWEISAKSDHGLTIQNVDAHFVVRNVTIRDGYTGFDGVRLFQANNGTIADCTVYNCDTGLSIRNSRNIVLTGNQVSSCTYIGVYADGCEHLLMDWNRVFSTWYLGIHIRHCVDATLENNTFGENAESAIRFEQTSSSSAIRNHFTADNQGLECMYCSDIVAEENAFQGNFYASFHIMDSMNIKIVRNNISLNNVSGMIFRDSTFMAIQNNSVLQIVGEGIDLFDCDRATIIGNYLRNNSEGLRLDRTSNSSIEENEIYNSSISGLSLTGCANIDVKWNTISNNSIGIKLRGCVEVSVSNNTLMGNDLQAEDDNGRDNHWDDSFHFPPAEINWLFLIFSGIAVGAIIVFIVFIFYIERKERERPPAP